MSSELPYRSVDNMGPQVCIGSTCLIFLAYAPGLGYSMFRGQVFRLGERRFRGARSCARRAPYSYQWYQVIRVGGVQSAISLGNPPHVAKIF